jgi:hypothetical protein
MKGSVVKRGKDTWSRATSPRSRRQPHFALEIQPDRQHGLTRGREAPWAHSSLASLAIQNQVDPSQPPRLFYCSDASRV